MFHKVVAQQSMVKILEHFLRGVLYLWDLSKFGLVCCYVTKNHLQTNMEIKLNKFIVV